jgi:hypothetical protein
MRTRPMQIRPLRQDDDPDSSAARLADGHRYRFDHLTLPMVMKDMRFESTDPAPGDYVPAFDLPTARRQLLLPVGDNYFCRRRVSKGSAGGDRSGARNCRAGRGPCFRSAFSLIQNTMTAVGACGKPSAVFQGPVGAFCASTGPAASTASGARAILRASKSTLSLRSSHGAIVDPGAS